MSERVKKKSADQSLGYHDTFAPNYRPAGWGNWHEQSVEDAKMRELKKVMGGKPKDRRLLSRHLLAEKLGMRLVKLKELEKQGLIDVKKSDIIEKMNSDIRRILRGK